MDDKNSLTCIARDLAFGIIYAVALLLETMIGIALVVAPGWAVVEAVRWAIS